MAAFRCARGGLRRVLLIGLAVVAWQSAAPPARATAPTDAPSQKGYWLVASDGSVFGFGDAGDYGSAGGTHLAKPIVGMAATPTGHGYWLVASEGGVFGYGDAGYYGSKGSGRHKKQIVGILATRTGHGYSLVASDGTVASYGDASFRNTHAYSKAIIGLALTPTGQGAWLAA